MTDTPEPIVSPVLDGTPHGFMTRSGGVSTGAVSGLQCGYGAGDDALAVAENRRLVVAAVLPGATLLTPYQVHSPDVRVVRDAFAMADRPKVDALVTDRSGLLLGIVTADCAPVLLADRERGVIGAAHAGWRGAQGEVIANTVAAMEQLGARPGAIAAAIGPCIAQVSYEVGADMRAQFAEEDHAFFAPGKSGHYQFDLAGYVAAQLRRSGVDTVHDSALDTYGDPARFYSFRRATHRGEADYGRQISVIGL